MSGILNQEREKLLSVVRVRLAGAPEFDSVLRLVSEVFNLGVSVVIMEAMNAQTEAQVIKALIEMQHELLQSEGAGFPLDDKHSGSPG